jgi:hypothetical protein
MRPYFVHQANSQLSVKNWKDPHYLLAGNKRQQLAYAALQNLGIWSTLSAFDPVLAGTVPLDIDIANSDLDILCAVDSTEMARFVGLLQAQYAHLPEFIVTQKLINQRPSVVCSFRFQEFEVEVFGQDCPTERQQAFRHMVVEDRVLQAGGEAWRAAVRRLKEQGLKTEPAFAKLLQLKGDPYESLLTLEGTSVEELRTALAPLSPLVGTV